MKCYRYAYVEVVGESQSHKIEGQGHTQSRAQLKVKVTVLKVNVTDEGQGHDIVGQGHTSESRAQLKDKVTVLMAKVVDGQSHKIEGQGQSRSQFKVLGEGQGHNKIEGQGHTTKSWAQLKVIVKGQMLARTLVKS